MIYEYSILGTTIHTNESIAMLHDFEATNTTGLEPQIKWEIQDTADENRCYGIQYVPPKSMETMKRIFFSQKDKTQYLYSTKEDYSTFCLNRDIDCSSEVLMELFLIGFYSYMTKKETLLMHASAVEHNGKAVVFTAPSGTGKTTQAELWATNLGAKILNGDKVFLKQETDGIHAWGSPWKGSSPYGCNESAPLQAIVVLEQAEANKIKKLDPLEALQYFAQHVFFPCWDETCEQSVFTFLDKVLHETEVYLLQCKPDEEAVYLVKGLWDK